MPSAASCSIQSANGPGQVTSAKIPAQAGARRSSRLGLQEEDRHLRARHRARDAEFAAAAPAVMPARNTFSTSSWKRLACGTSVKSAMNPAEIVADERARIGHRHVVQGAGRENRRRGVHLRSAHDRDTGRRDAADLHRRAGLEVQSGDRDRGPDARGARGRRDRRDRGPGTARHAENSDVFPAASVAVAVIHAPSAADGRTATKATLPPESVIWSAAPRNRWPGPLPEASQTIVEKNSIR